MHEDTLNILNIFSAQVVKILSGGPWINLVSYVTALMSCPISLCVCAIMWHDLSSLVNSSVAVGCLYLWYVLESLLLMHWVDWKQTGSLNFLSKSDFFRRGGFLDPSVPTNSTPLGPSPPRLMTEGEDCGAAAPQNSKEGQFRNKLWNWGLWMPFCVTFYSVKHSFT